MAERDSTRRYLSVVRAGLIGSDRSRRRLLTELADHLEDAVASKVADGVAPADAERLALAELGEPSAIVSAWRGRTERARGHQRTRVALAAAFASAAAAVLGVTSAASGHRSPPAPLIQRPSGGTSTAQGHGMRPQRQDGSQKSRTR